MENDPDPEVEEKVEEEVDEKEVMKHVIRSADGGTVTIDNYCRSLAIKLFCVECLGWDENPKKTCLSNKCPLFPYRGGKLLMSLKSDKNKKVLTEGEKKVLRDRMAKMHEAMKVKREGGRGE